MEIKKGGIFIKLENIGKIQNRKFKNWFIIIKNDVENTGGYLVIQSPTKDFSLAGYDNWFINLEEVIQYIEFNGLLIEWDME